MNGIDYEWLEVVETPQKSLVRVIDENAPIEDGWEHVHTKYYKDSSNRVVEISYVFRRKKSTTVRSLYAETKFLN